MLTKKSFETEKDKENNTFAVTLDDDGSGVLTIVKQTTHEDLDIDNIYGDIYVSAYWFNLEANEQGIKTAKQIVSAINEWIKRTENKVFE